MTRRHPIDCFFCLAPSTVPSRQHGPRSSWQCARCGCWNIRDKQGEMVHDLPAMHNSQLNNHSFSLRARPSSSHLPSTLNTSPFCRSCLANQTLIMNMLANYLPDDNDPSFPSLYDSLPTYISNLHSRYPPVCTNCQPAVDAALKKSDQRAQSEAWGSALHRGSTSREASSLKIGWIEVLVWRIRGVLYGLGCVLSWARGILGISRLLHHSLPSFNSSLARQSILAFHLFSIFWIAWDPFWLSRARSQDQPVQGRKRWIKIMLLVLLLRLFSSLVDMDHYSSARFNMETLHTTSLILEMLLFAHVFSSIRSTRRIPLQLIRPITAQNTSRTFTESTTPQPLPLESLSLKDEPVRSHHPVFGQTSFSSPPPDEPIEMMDWEPTHARGQERCPSDWDTFATGKQSMFPQRTEETGLESLLADWGISGPPEARAREVKQGQCIIA